MAITSQVAGSLNCLLVDDLRELVWTGLVNLAYATRKGNAESRVCIEVSRNDNEGKDNSITP